MKKLFMRLLSFLLAFCCGYCAVYALSFLIWFDLPELTMYHHGVVWAIAAAGLFQLTVASFKG